MKDPRLERHEIVAAVEAALAPLDAVLSLVECGSASFGRVDEYSDLDLGVVVRDGQVGAVLAVIEAALADLSPIEHVYRPPPGSWAELTQRFYRLQDAGPFLFVDVCVFEASAPDKLDHPAIHGEARVLIDRGPPREHPPLEAEEERRRCLARVEEVAERFEMLHVLVEKELHRGRSLELMGFYQGLVQRPLVELLRIRHAPLRSGFHTRLVHDDLPEELVERLEPFFYPADPAAVEARHREATAWIRALVDELREELTPAGGPPGEGADAPAGER